MKKLKIKLFTAIMLLSMACLPLSVKADACQDCIDNCEYIFNLDAAICSTQYLIDCGWCAFSSHPIICIANAAKSLKSCLDAAQKSLDSCLDGCPCGG